MKKILILATMVGASLVSYNGTSSKGSGFGVSTASAIVHTCPRGQTPKGGPNGMHCE